MFKFTSKFKQYVTGVVAGIAELFTPTYAAAYRASAEQRFNSQVALVSSISDVHYRAQLADIVVTDARKRAAEYKRHRKAEKRCRDQARGSAYQPIDTTCKAQQVKYAS